LLCAHSLPSSWSSQLFHYQDVLKDQQAPRALPDLLDQPALLDQKAREDRPGRQDRPDCKEKRARLVPRALPAWLVRREPPAVSVRRDQRVQKVHLGLRAPQACTPSAKRAATPNAYCCVPLARKSCR
jgi:hypothetical protein